MTSTLNPPSPTTAAPATPMSLLARHAATSTASSLAEVAGASRRALAGARGTSPVEFATRGARWWSSLLDRRTTPRVVAAIYRLRWQIELFFKWL